MKPKIASGDQGARGSDVAHFQVFGGQAELRVAHPRNMPIIDTVGCSPPFGQPNITLLDVSVRHFGIRWDMDSISASFRWGVGI